MLAPTPIPALTPVLVPWLPTDVEGEVEVVWEDGVVVVNPSVVDTAGDVFMLKRDVEYLDCDVPEDIDDNPIVLVGMQAPKTTDTPPSAVHTSWINCLASARSFAEQTGSIQHKMVLVKLSELQMHLKSVRAQPVNEMLLRTQL
jgi:hypothetical protein